ncbi:MAG: helical backbone metal receptor [Gemmatimonadetes bacterium]|nr:helical backbone metal receptor [Gemmatimonadota bacterium]
MSVLFLGRRRVGTALVIAIELTACRGQSVPQGAGGVIDDLGRTVVLSGPAERIVSLSPAITELLFAIGAGDRVVARTEWDKYPPQVADIPSVGDALGPSVERIAAHRPDLVAMYAASSNAQAIDRLEAVGIPSVNIRLDSLASVARAARVLGRLTGLTASADSLAAVFQATLDSARRAAPREGGLRVVILASDNPPIVIGGGSFLSEFLQLAGAQNVFADIAAPSAPVALETIAVRDPDLFLNFTFQEPAFAARPEWQTIAAVRERRFAVVGGSFFEYPSPRAFDAIRELRDALAGVMR